MKSEVSDDDSGGRLSFMDALNRTRPTNGSGTPTMGTDPLNGFHGPQGAATAYGSAALAREAATVGGQTEGERNDTLNRAAFALGQLVHAGHLTTDDVRDTLTEAGQRCGLSLTETERTIASGLRAAEGKPRDKVPDPNAPKINGGVDAIDSIAREVINTDTGEVTDTTVDFWDARPYLAHLRLFALARMCSPWAVLGVSLLRALAVVPPNVVLPGLVGGSGSLNLFAALVGRSGAGKGAAESAAADAIRWPAIYTASVGSGEGIAHQYAHRGKDDVIMDRFSVLFTCPEVDTLAALGSRQGATLLTQLRSAFSGERLGFGYADALKRIPIERHGYRLGLICGVQPEKAGPLINDSDGGTPQRFIWLRATDPAITATPPEQPAPWPFKTPEWNLLPVDLNDGGRRRIPVPDQVADLVRNSAAARARDEGDALDGHALFAREKVAYALAVLDGRAVMTDEDWQLSGVVMAVSDRTRAGIQNTLTIKERQAEEGRKAVIAGRAVATDEAVIEAATRRVVANIRRYLAADLEIGWSDLRRKVGRDVAYLGEAVHRLAAIGDIRDERDGNRRVIRWATTGPE